jgi:hypothetical protein
MHGCPRTRPCRPIRRCRTGWRCVDFCSQGRRQTECDRARSARIWFPVISLRTTGGSARSAVGPASTSCLCRCRRSRCHADRLGPRVVDGRERHGDGRSPADRGCPLGTVASGVRWRRRRQPDRLYGVIARSPRRAPDGPCCHPRSEEARWPGHESQRAPDGRQNPSTAERARNWGFHSVLTRSSGRGAVWVATAAFEGQPWATTAPK